MTSESHINTDITPLEGIRVWRGFRNQTFLDNRKGFEEKLGSIFVPVTAQWMMPLGLNAYFPALLPNSSLSAPLPDEVALVIYPSPESYKRASYTTTTGRAYGELHSTVFGFTDTPLPHSRSGFPLAWTPKWQAGEAYGLTTASTINWQQGQTRLLAGRLNEPLAQLRQDITEAITHWCDFTGPKACACLFVVEEGYLVCWEHVTDSCPVAFSLIDALSAFLTKCSSLDIQAAVVEVPSAGSWDDPGVPFTEGQCLDVRLNQHYK